MRISAWLQEPLAPRADEALPRARSYDFDASKLADYAGGDYGGGAAHAAPPK